MFATVLLPPPRMSLKRRKRGSLNVAGRISSKVCAPLAMPLGSTVFPGVSCSAIYGQCPTGKEKVVKLR